MVSKNDKPVTMGEEKADILHAFFLLQSSLALSLPSSFQWRDSRMATEVGKFLSL